MLILFIIKVFLLSSFCLTEEIKDVINETEDKLSSDFELTSERLSQNQRIFNIGAVLSTAESIVHFLQAIDDLNYETEISRTGIKLHGVAVPKDPNPIKNTLNVCEKLLSAEIYGVIIDDTSPSITYTTTFHNIPTIGISNRDAVLSDRSLYATFVRTVPSYANQADVWVEILNHFNFSCVVAIHSNDINGRSVQNRFEMLADLWNIKLEAVIEYEIGFPDISRHLEETKQSSACRVFTLYTNHEDSEAIFQQIINLNMSEPGYVWIASEQVLGAKNRPIGVLALKLNNFDDIEGHIKDSVYILGMALKDMINNDNNITKPPIDCRDLSRPKWKSGSLLFSLTKNQRLELGKTGCVAFDERGDRVNSEYTIVNVANDQVNQDVGIYRFSEREDKMILKLNENKIIWSGNSMEKPIGYEVPNHFRVATIAEEPFVWVIPVGSDGDCPPEHILCPKVDQKTGIEHKYCCKGYCIDLLQSLAGQLNFTYSLHQVPDGLYGGFSFVNGSDRKIWTGLVGELYYKRADMVVAPLTINPERSLAIEFTKPFKYQGLQIIQKKQSIHRLRHPLASFLQPFQNGLWVSVFVSVHVVALALYLLDRFSPFGRYKLPNCDVTEEDALNLSSAIWFAWGVLLNSGIGEGTPRSFSGRVLGMVWAGFAMIVVASYTANLAAFLVLDRPETPLTGINDPRLRNPVEGFNYSTVRDSSVDMYFRRQVELTHMYRRMREIIYDNAEDAIAAVKSGDLNAFIWDSARLDYEAAKDCDLSTSGELFGRSGYAIGMTKGNHFWSNKVTFVLLELHERGFMENLDNKWIFFEQSENCEEKSENFPATLGLKNMAGVFILVGFGILAGIGLIMFEIAYKKRSTSKQRRIDLARNAIDKWKEVIENRKRLVESLNQNAKQRYYQKHHQFKYHNTRTEEPTPQSIDTMPYTVEKGLNAITGGTSHETLERRPKLKRGFSIGSETDLDVLPAPLEMDSQTDKCEASGPKASKSGAYESANTNYMSLV